MAEQEKQDNQKTIVAFAAGLLIGGLLVWVFTGAATPANNDADDSDTTTTSETADMEDDAADDDTSADTDTESEVETPVMQTGTGAVELGQQQAGSSVTLESATFPSDDGWIGVRDYANDQLGGILGVARFSKSQGLIPEKIILQRSTKAGNTYAIVFFSENGDRIFNLANDVQSEGIVRTFTVQ